VSCRGKTHSGTCAIAVASLACELLTASLPLAAQPLTVPADEPSADVEAGFGERFSPGLRVQPLFTHPDIQELLASLPPPESVLAAGDGAEPAEPQPTENTASVTTQDSAPGPGPSALNDEERLPELPPPPPPAEVVLPSTEEIAAAAQPHEAPQAPSATASVGVPETAPLAAEPQAEASGPPIPRAGPGHRAEPGKKPAVKKRLRQGAPRAKTRAIAPPEPPATGVPATCRAGAACVSQQQTVAIFFGFIAGALLGGPVGAIAGGTLGAAMTSPKAPQGAGPGPAPAR